MSVYTNVEGKQPGEPLLLAAGVDALPVVEQSYVSNRLTAEQLALREFFENEWSSEGFGD